MPVLLSSSLTVTSFPKEVFLNSKNRSVWPKWFHTFHILPFEIFWLVSSTNEEKSFHEMSPTNQLYMVFQISSLYSERLFLRFFYLGLSRAVGGYGRDVPILFDIDFITFAHFKTRIKGCKELKNHSLR